MGDRTAAGLAPRSSWWFRVFVALVFVLAVADIVVFVAVQNLVLRDEPEVMSAPTSAAPPEPRPSGAACEQARVGLCADRDQGVAPVPGSTVADWFDRLPERHRPVYSRQEREGLLEGTLSVREPVSGKPAGGIGAQMTVNSQGRVILTYGADSHLRTVECAVDVAGRAPLSEQALDFVKQCAFATLTDDVAAATRAWLDAKLGPIDRPIDPTDPFGAASLTTLHWSCGWLALRLTFSEAHADVAVSAPSGRAPAACAEGG
ncbi:hypothetical protein KZZ52_23880 [Dactylosporangium sp. AC04546]|uniref:hypothetical protein n=1 Tax=Dactylosporangium sp. AC04546 TaxID=2862460 RepID=UPI001EE13DDE|nr:hypothetical protein [Dactylosporangium sp. AC04546]WVK88317.1 hypothetical protein KZZ52_23880 [Dactylosporangium sp. AC04546]